MLNEAKVLEMIRTKKVKKQKGASMIEYALVVAAIVTIGGVLFVGDGTGTVDGAIQTKMNSVATQINS